MGTGTFPLKTNGTENTKSRNEDWENSGIADASLLLTINSDYILINLGARDHDWYGMCMHACLHILLCNL